MNLVIINTESASETNDLLSKRLFAIKNQRLGGDVEELALVIGALNNQRIYHTDTGRWQEPDFCTGEGSIRDLPGTGNHVQSCHLL